MVTLPERGPGGEEQNEPFMRWENGDPCTRDQLRRLLGDAGEDFGFARSDTGTHSLRIGGASAAYFATGGNKDAVQRLGRWASDAFAGYVWEDRSLTAGLARAMLKAPWNPPRGAF